MEEREIPNSPEELLLAQNVHKQLLERYGEYRSSEWEPTEDNVAIMNDEEFEEFQRGLLESIEDNDRVSSHIGNMLAYADFETGRLMVRRSHAESEEDSFRQTLAHEMLHLWFGRSEVEDKTGSYFVNETFVDTLALEGLGMFDLPKEERSQPIDNAINNAIFIKAVVDEMGEEGWKSLFEVCQSGDQSEIRKLTKIEFGSNPRKRELRELNKHIPRIYGTTFWERFKETALAIYMIRSDPDFQKRNPSVDYSLYLVSEWAGITDAIEEELD